MTRKLLVTSFLLASGAARADSAYSIRVEAEPAKKAARSSVRLHIAPQTGYHFNPSYPTSLTLAAADVTVEKTVVSAKEAGADLEIPFTPATSGKKTLSGDLKFAVCDANSCYPKREAIHVTVEVK